LILFDEPLSNVDAKVREQLRFQLRSMQRAFGFAALYVTHDQVEAMELAHRIAVMRNGKIEQLGTPREVYEQPSSRYVANFVGTTNEVEGTVLEQIGSRCRVSTALGELLATAAVTDEVAAGQTVTLVWRPERCQLSLAQTGAPNCWPAHVDASVYVGAYTQYVVTSSGQTFRLVGSYAESYGDGSTVWISIDPDQLRVVTAS
jgi:iron(III) transport system ATP-binding protein